jgi:DTW domain-containing protein YfiP
MSKRRRKEVLREQVGDIAEMDVRDCEKFTVLSTLRVQRKRAEMQERGRCMKCWHEQQQCICERLLPLQMTKNIQFLIYMHNHELYNASNTSKLLLASMPDAAELFVFGEADTDGALRARVAVDAMGAVESGSNEDSGDISGVSGHSTAAWALARARKTVLLYPSEEAIAAEEMVATLEVAEREDQDDGMGELKAALPKVPVQILVVDGTWRQVCVAISDICAVAVPNHSCVSRQVRAMVKHYRKVKF